jgi:hypothetical protein
LHPKQSLAFKSEANEVLYGGSAGGGKSHLMRVMSLYYAFSVPNIQIYLFRRLSEDLKKNHLDGASGFNAMLNDYINAGVVKVNYTTNQIVFDNGAKIHLCHCQYQKDVLKYQGVEINVLFIDELTHFDEYIYKFLRSRVRLGGLKVGKEFENKLPKIFTSSNPGGEGHEFVKRYFIDNKEPLKLYRQDAEQGGMLRQFIPARLTDNPTMLENDPTYEDKLLGLGGALAKAMLEGDWDAIEGAYFDQFDTSTHVIAPFEIPQHWARIRAMDWGYSAPFCVLWGAVSDGIEHQGRWLPRGSIVIYREFYGCEREKFNSGVKFTNTQIATRIKELENEEIATSVADPAIYANNGGISIYEDFIRNDVHFMKADNKRIPGWQQIRRRLAGEESSENRPLLYFFDNCKNLLRTLPIMQYDNTNAEDLNTKLEDHAVDTLRYLCMTRPLIVDEEKRNNEQFALYNIINN